MTIRFALIRNPHSRKNRMADGTFRKKAQHRLGSFFVEPCGRDSILQCVADLARKDVRCIAIDGGDGTVSDVMSAINRVYPPDSLPTLAIFPSGNTNLIATDIGFGLRGERALDRLDELLEEDSFPLKCDIRRRHALGIYWSDPARMPVLGMFHGTAAFTRAIALAHSPTILRRFSHDTAVAATLVSALGRMALSRKERRTWLQGDRLGLSIAGRAMQEQACFLFISTTLKKLSLGIWPFWREKGAPDEGISYLNVHAPPPAFLSAAFSLFRGYVPLWIRGSAAYESGSAPALRLKTRQKFVLDGEVFDTGDDGMTYLFLGPRFDFIQAPGA